MIHVMKYWWVGYFVGMLSGITLGFIAWVFVPILTEPSMTDALNGYYAYRECIPDHECKMTVEHWLDYYEIKWRLEDRGILD